jgi:hypothetical protein
MQALFGLIKIMKGHRLVYSILSSKRQNYIIFGDF